MEPQVNPDLQQKNETEITTELDHTVGAEGHDEQTPIASDVEEYDEIVLAGDEQASQYSPEEVLVHKLSKVRKRAKRAEADNKPLQDENAELRRQLKEMRTDFGYEDEVQAPPQPQVQQIPDEVFNDHYQRAAKLKVNDYEETERALRDKIGGDVVDAIVVESEGKSEMVIYHLQKNPRALDQLNHVLQSGNVNKAQKFLWTLANKLEVKPAKRDPVPAPESIPTGSKSGGSLEAQLDSVRNKYMSEINSGGDGKELFNQMKALKAQIRSQ